MRKAKDIARYFQYLPPANVRRGTVNFMYYVSTRGNGGKVTSAQAIKQGIAADGGLFVPESLPAFSEAELKAMLGMSYSERAVHVLGKFLCDYSEEELTAYCEKAYSEDNFRSSGTPAPVVSLNDRMSVLELYHGPTSAFKDMALQLMPHLLAGALEKTGEKKDAFILTATSGDTGKAALEGYRDAPRVKIMVFYPVDGVSSVQKLQMSTQTGENVFVCPVNGNFDDAQSGVKRIFSDKTAIDYMNERGYFFSSANSINWGRLAPQIVYYVSAYCDMVSAGTIEFGDTIDVCVPTGNFGDIFAAYIAKKCGLKLGRLVCASNKNNVLTDFFNTGSYNRNRNFYTTMSPSMDILISSNLERLLYYIAGSSVTADCMKRLNSNGKYTVSSEVLKESTKEFYGYCASEEQTGSCIAEIYKNYKYLIDPHTAVGVYCAQKYLEEVNTSNKILCVSTASPYKFASNVYKSLTGKVLADEFEYIDALSAFTGTIPPKPLSELRSKEIRFNPSLSFSPSEMLSCVKKAAE